MGSIFPCGSGLAPPQFDFLTETSSQVLLAQAVSLQRHRLQVKRRGSVTSQAPPPALGHSCRDRGRPLPCAAWERTWIAGQSRVRVN
jgi:hypothetical protein